MSATNITGSADGSEDSHNTNGGESSERHAHTQNTKTPRLKLEATPLASLGIAVAVGLGVLMEKTEVRDVCSHVLQDPKVQKVCRAAAREIVASWRRHGGMAALAHTFLR
jgi:hypothetical protein